MTDLKNRSKLRSVKSLQTEKPAKNAPPLPEAYHRARRNLVLFSAILLSWEFVGIVPKVDASPSLFGISVGITNHSAIPFVVSLLVLFFSVRLLVEWQQVDEERRKHTFARIDASISGALAVLAMSVFAFQTISGIDIVAEYQALDWATKGILVYSISAVSFTWVAWNHNRTCRSALERDKGSAVFQRRLSIFFMILSFFAISVAVFLLFLLDMRTSIWTVVSNLLMMASLIYSLFISVETYKLAKEASASQ